MRYQTIPRWTYVMLTVMGLGFMAGAVGFILFVPAPTGAIVGGIWLVVFGGMALFSLRALRGRADDDRIRREGTPATATVRSVNTTNWTINNVPQWKLQLRIDGAGVPYETSLKLMTYNPPADGASFGVRVDPLKRDHVVLSGDDPRPAASGASPAAADGTPGTADTVRLLADLDRMRADGSLSEAEFAAVKAKLLGGT